MQQENGKGNDLIVNFLICSSNYLIMVKTESKGIYTKIYDELLIANKILSSMTKQDKGKWIWLRRNAVTITLIIAIAALCFSYWQFTTQLGNEAAQDKIRKTQEIEAIIIEFQKNLELIDDYSQKKNDYVGGDLVVQYTLSVDNLTEVLKRADISDVELVRGLWNIKFYSSQVNAKIFDARAWAVFVSPDSRRIMQEEIFEAFEHLEPLLKEAVNSLQKYKNQIH